MFASMMPDGITTEPGPGAGPGQGPGRERDRGGTGTEVSGD
jgi:hypothetical protein